LPQRLEPQLIWKAFSTRPKLRALSKQMFQRGFLPPTPKRKVVSGRRSWGVTSVILGKVTIQVIIGTAYGGELAPWENACDEY